MNIYNMAKHRPFLLGMILIGLSSIFAFQLSYCTTAGTAGKKVLILGIDGMDPKILTRLMNTEKMPNFKRLSETGSFRPLRTSIPPQSPVAWSNFITGMNPGGHGIFDFIHRDPTEFKPYLSTSRTEPPKRAWKVKDWVIPLSSGKVELLRKGKAFWEILEDHGVPCTIIKMPANFPPVECKSNTLSGMGTPDLLGGYGTFSFYTEMLPENKESISGGEVYLVQMVDNQIDAHIIGPENTFKKGSPPIKVPFTLYSDPVEPVAKIEIQDTEFILQEGEFSDWIQIKFDTIPYVLGTTGICRFYLKQVRPVFQLYISPINIDPSAPALPISTPDHYSCDLFHSVGYFYTQGMAEDTKALSGGIFTDAEYIQQAKIVLDERLKLFQHAMEEFKEGLLFFYFSSLDQNSHMFWRLMDSDSPLYDKEAADVYGEFIDELYRKMDGVLGNAMKSIDKSTTLMIMSDHGFAPFYRAFNLNTWLWQNGYISLVDEENPGKGEYFANVDWSKTKAYGLGINGLYINQENREHMGIVPDGPEKQQLVDEIARKLEEVVDPESGKKVVKRAYKTHEVFTGEHVDEAPEIIVGYDWGFRGSWDTALGEFSKELFEDNMDKWSGDHCMAADVTPGILLINRKIKILDPALYDLTATILDEFGIDIPTEMVGKPLQ